MDRQELCDALSRYAQRLHAQADQDHHVLSALGAWILLALCCELAEDEQTCSQLSEILGVEPHVAATYASELLTEPHPLVAAAAGVWFPPRFATARVERWRAALPPAVETGDLPTQDAMDCWSAERTMGMIEHFPIDLTPDTLCLLATALATKISWERPFDVVDATALAPGPWSARLDRVLQAPRDDPRHRQFVVHTKTIGSVAVHLAGARDGLLVGSVIAADETVPASEVLPVAHQLVCAEAREQGSTARVSLFELPLGDGPIWSVGETEVETMGSGGREEHLASVLPAWAAETHLDLRGNEPLGFATAAGLLAEAFGVSTWRYDARQRAVARYSAVGFEAAAVTGFAVATSARARRPGRRRDATIRFAHPYAVVAAGWDGPLSRVRCSAPTPWHGVPVFSAWISEPSDADLVPASNA